MYTEKFLEFYKEVEPVFGHRLYVKGEPAVGLLKAQDYYLSLRDGTFMDEYRVTNPSVIHNYAHAERILMCTEDDILYACTSYKPLDRKLSLPDYFLSHTRFSLIIEDILRPGYMHSKEALKKLYPDEYSVIEAFSYIDKNVYRDFIDVMDFPDNIKTKTKVLNLYNWWLPHKDMIWRFADSDVMYQKTFRCLLDHVVSYFDTWDNKEIVYNIFGITTGKNFESFLDYCERRGYNLKYDPRSWVLPWNRKIIGGDGE